MVCLALWVPTPRAMVSESVYHAHRPRGGLLQGDAHGLQQRKERALEVSFHEEIKALRMGAGEVFHGEGILAITKGLLQSGVS